MKTKKLYIAPTTDCYTVQLDMVCDSIKVQAKSISGTEDGFERGANTRQVHEDGLRDWNIDLW